MHSASTHLGRHLPEETDGGLRQQDAGGHNALPRHGHGAIREGYQVYVARDV